MHREPCLLTPTCHTQRPISLQVFVVFDGLLDSAPYEVVASVLSCGAKLVAAVAPTASCSAASAGQLEWMLHAVQSLVHQLQPPQPGQQQQQQHGGSGGSGAYPARSPEQQRSLAGHLVMVVHAIYVHDVRLPRLQGQLMVSVHPLQMNTDGNI